MKILGFLITGLLAGWIAGELVFGDGFGLIGNLVLGVVGAVVGGFVLDLAGKEKAPEGFIPSLLTSILGAVITLLIANLIF
jgi:uncharacterized membrane protein YeaQ/YmgE (transglycosylase-associated protein family)